MKKPSIKEAFDQIQKFYKSIIVIIIYAGSFGYAFKVFVFSSKEVSLFPFLVFFGFTGVVLNYLLYCIFSKGYHLWGYKSVKDSPIEIKLILAPFLPPVSTFFMSSALCVYGASFFSEYFQEIWSANPILLPETLEGFLGSLLFMFIIFVISFTSMFTLSYLFATWFKSVSSGMYLILVLLCLLIIFGSGALYWFLQDNELLLSVFNSIVYIIIGFIPFHWVYHIFLVPLRAKFT